MSKQREALKRLYTIIREPPMSPLEHRLADIIEEALAEPEPWTPDGLSMDERKPLNPDQIMLLANQASGKYWGTEAHIVAIVRLVEKAHGIGD